MSDFKVISTNVVLEAANDPVYEPPQPPSPLSDQLFCGQFYSCTEGYCYKHGCIEALLGKQKEVRS